MEMHVYYPYIQHVPLDDTNVVSGVDRVSNDANSFHFFNATYFFYSFFFVQNMKKNSNHCSKINADMSNCQTLWI